MKGLNKAELWHRVLKDNYSMDDFCAEFECRASDIESLIDKFVSNDKREAADIKKRIKQNSKNKQKSPKVKARRQQRLLKEYEEVKIEAVPKSNSDVEVKTEIEELPKRETLDLEHYLGLESRLSQEVMNLEAEHEAKLKPHYEIIDSARKIQAEFSELEKVIKDAKARLQELSRKDAIAVEKANETFEKLRKKREELASVREKIAEMKTVQLIACKDSDILPVDDNPEISCLIAETSADDKVKELFKDGALRDLRMRDLEMLAKLLVLTSMEEYRFVIEFEDDEVKEAFEKLVVS